MSKYTILFTSSGGGLSAELRRRILNESKYNLNIIAVDAKDFPQAKIFANYFEKVPNGSDKNYSNAITNIINKYDVNLVIPCSDEEALNLSKNRSLFERKGCQLAAAEYDILRIISNKLSTYEFLEKKNFTVPNYLKVNTPSELERIIFNMLNNFKEIVVKPATGRGGRNVEIIGNESTDMGISADLFLHSKIQQYESLYPLIVMEKLKEPIYDIDILARDGKLIRSLVRRRLNPRKPNEGHIIEKNNELYQIAENLVKVFNLSWLYDCDFMINMSGEPFLLEINPRPSGSLAIALAAGINFIDDLIALEKKDNLNNINIPFGKVIYPYSSLH